LGMDGGGVWVWVTLLFEEAPGSTVLLMVVAVCMGGPSIVKTQRFSSYQWRVQNSEKVKEGIRKSFDPKPAPDNKCFKRRRRSYTCIVVLVPSSRGPPHDSTDRYTFLHHRQ
jgi:hypothetical protein